MLKGDVVRIAEKHLARLVRSDFDAADYDVIHAASEAGDEAVPVVLDELRITPHALGDGINDFVLEARKLVTGVVKSVWRVAVGIGGPAQDGLRAGFLSDGEGRGAEQDGSEETKHQMNLLRN